MKSPSKKRKGVEELLNGGRYTSSIAYYRSHVSLEDYSRLRKRGKEDVIRDDCRLSESRVSGVVTAPPYGSLPSGSPTRGIKRKIGCIDAATRTGRKKKIEQDYYLGATIGKGKFGSVRMCWSKASGEVFACKTLAKGEEPVHREVEIMQHLSGHVGIVTLKAVYEDVESFYLVMEFCPGGRLLDQMARERRYCEQQAANILRELVMVIKYCHDMGVVHRDIKPENVLLTSSGGLKLADFGLAVRIVNGQSLSGVVGTPAYVAPEILAGEYSEKVDIWSAGVLLHALLIGVLPFQGSSLEACFESIKSVDLNFDSGLWITVSQPAKDLIARMLTRDVSTRLSADEVLKHPWLLFYADPPLKTLTLKLTPSKSRRMTSRDVTVKKRNESENKQDKPADSHRVDSDNDSSTSRSTSSSCKLEEDSGLVDALAVAVSCMNITETKRIRLCNPPSTISISHECSSNLKTNLCTAF
ncbi:serine/threonine-protein kinase PEPKR2-like [Chenopodium quinoa]|uniref:serine/threonine-protein kinase PEPKR2-like n=1 Tax=Chenopodium quinoa TaxID=63459 RepID=UPI000B772E55|nr:serine/threonine-protein kinase PEPKR2-like [Chenopodium quinoa]